jgi:16S rRNA (cytidine1402-2'-O)-methyltransferase
LPCGEPMTHSTPRGTLYLMPTPLDFGCEEQAPLDHVLPTHNLRIALGIQHWISENAKTTRSFIKRVLELAPQLAHQLAPGIAVQPLQERQIVELPRLVHKKGDAQALQAGFDAKPLLQAALSGHDIALVSEAGMPAIADPGSSVVAAAQALGIRVVPLIGPCSLLLALAASGLNGQNFAFVGYLPQDAALRSKRLIELENLARKTGQSQLWIETPYRNAAMMQAMTTTLQAKTRVLVASGLSMSDASVITRTAQEWKQSPAQWPKDQPCVFGLG